MPSIEFFPYYGPNRRTDHIVVEVILDFDAGGQIFPPDHSALVRDLLIRGGILTEQEAFPQQALPDEAKPRYASLFLQTALLMQRKAGHKVGYFSFSDIENQNKYLALLEHEHYDVGMTAVKLAYELVEGRRTILAEPFNQFREFAQERLLQRETRAIIDAATDREIPHIRLERHLYTRPLLEQLATGDQGRRNGLLVLGNGVYQHILDGTFCIDRSAGLENLVGDKGRRLAVLRGLEIPVFDSENSDLSDYSVHSFVAVNGRVIAAVDRGAGKRHPLESVHVSLIDTVLAVNRALESAPVVVSIVTADIGRALGPGRSGVSDFDIAPRLEAYLTPETDGDSELLTSTAKALVDWLFPASSKTSVPIIAITGTNGKTTTTRMVNHIMMQTDATPGMVCTDGVFIGGEKIADGDYGALTGHLNALIDKRVDIAVLETHHQGILTQGFAFKHCDIAVCLNVSEDHLIEGQIATIEQMAKVKQALPERARHAAVLFADDPNCLAMIDSMVADNIGMVSMAHGVDVLAERVGTKVTCFCVLEWIEAREWLVIHDRGRRLPVMEVNSIAASDGGKARYNVGNAMHAVLAAYYANVSMETIRAALGRFVSSYETTPGRLNEFDTLPFRIIMDFAHNPDGVKKVCEYIDRLDVPGRKLVAFAGTSTRADDTLRRVAHAVAGHFDFYFCKEYAPRSGRLERYVAHIMQQGLLDKGIPESQMAVMTHGREVIFEIFDRCEPGDLLVMLLGHVEKNQLAGYINEYARTTS